MEGVAGLEGAYHGAVESIAVRGAEAVAVAGASRAAKPGGRVTARVNEAGATRHVGDGPKIETRNSKFDGRAFRVANFSFRDFSTEL